MRQLPTDLEQFFDSIALVPDYTNCREMFLNTARGCVGVREESENSGVLVSLFQQSLGTPQAPNLPWCAFMLQACLAYVEKKTGRLSALYPSAHCKTMWLNSKTELATTSPRPGDIVVWSVGEDGLGHVGVIESMNSLVLHTIEGNTGPGTGYNRDGDGVYRRTRAKGGSKTFRELGFLRVYD